MRDRSNRYVIAAKRGMQSQLPSKWIEQLQSIDDLSFIGEPRSYRVLVEASPKAIELARNLLGDSCHIEPLIQHKSVR
ncbi:MAG: hypothetical protein QNJ65_20660 [Xenococcaceae cyanobacterium MO_234.B1]|nr:hypothetical protein [Xenococcaceae cyanobacterium MO_234.B1]